MAEKLTITVGADVAEALRAMQQLQNHINSLKKPTADATNALTNFNRILQDAPYGIQGLSNNLNPMLESFQRLQKETGSTGSAIRAMISGLAGPAGLGIAVAGISSLLVAFGGKLFSAGEASKKAAKDVDETTNSLQRMAASFAAENVTKVEAFRVALADMNIPLSKRNEVLDDYNKIAAKQNQLSEQDLTNINAITGALDRQIKLFEQRALVRAAEDQIKELYKVVFENKFNLQKLVAESGKGSAADIVNNLSDFDKAKIPTLPQEVEQSVSNLSQAQRNSLPVMKAYREQVKVTVDNLGLMPKVLDASGLSLQEQKDAFDKIGLTSKGFVNNMRNARIQINDLFAFIRSLVKDGGIDVLDLDKLEPKVKKAKEEAEKIIGKNPPILRMDIVPFEKPSFVGGSGPGKNPLIERLIAQADAALKATQQRAVNLADTISGTVTPAFQGLFDGILEGKNVIQSFFSGLANGLKQLISRLAATLVQALALKAVFSAFGLTSGIGVGSIGSIFKKLLGFADGGEPPVGRASWVGERGPELFIPKSRGTIIPNHQLGGFGGNIQVTVSELRLSGSDLIAAIAVNQRSQGRTF